MQPSRRATPAGHGGRVKATEPSQILPGSWTLESSHLALEPQSLTLRQFGPTVTGEAFIPGVDPIGPGQPVVSVTGLYVPPMVTLDIRIGTVPFGHYQANLDSANRLVGVFTLSTALGGGAVTLAYDRH